MTAGLMFGVVRARRYIPDVGYVAIAMAAVSVASFGIAGGLPTPLALASAGMMTALAAIAFILMTRLELALWAFVPLLTIVTAEPAPVDFMVVALFVALVARGEIFAAPPHPLAIVAAMLFVTSNLLALAFAVDVAAGIAHAAATMHLMVLGYVVYQLATRGREHAERAYIATGVGLAVLTLATLFGAPFGDLLRYDAERVKGLFKDPNVFGPFVLPAVTLLIMGVGPRAIVTRAALITVLAIPIAASQSRGALVAFAAATLTVGVVALYRRWKTSLAIVVLIGVLGIAGFTALALVSEQSSPQALLQERIYDANRFAAQDAGLGYLADQPLTLGVGPGNARAVLGTVNDIHETYLRILVETGPLGLVGLALMIWLGLSPLGVDRPGAAAWVAALVGFLALGFFIDIYHWRHFWLVVGIAMAYATAVRQG